MAAVLFRFFSFSSRNTINISAITRFTNISQLYAIRRSYYVKPKTQNKGSAKTWLTLAGVTLGAVGVSLYMLGRPEDNSIVGLEEEDKYAKENIFKAYLLRAKDTVLSFRNKYTEPSSTLLLPEPLPHPYQRRYTLLIELKDLLLHSDYDRKVGWKHQKRPGLDAFLQSLFDHYEIVVFTTDNAISTHPLIEKMDTNHFIIYRLYRDSTKYINGHHVKDLTHLNRSLNRVIIVDTNTESVKLQPENSLILNKWTGDIYDTSLNDLSSFLLTIAFSGTDDVRPILDYYKSQGTDVLQTFRANQAKLQDEETKRHSSYSPSLKKGPGSPITVFSLRGRQSSSSSPAPVDMPIATPTDTPTSEQSSGGGWMSGWFGWK